MNVVVAGSLIGLVKAYRWLLSPWVGSVCRFEPTCSVYAIEALERHGAVQGVVLAVIRVGRCHPWCAGGVDPVPDVVPGVWTRLKLFLSPKELP